MKRNKLCAKILAVSVSLAFAFVLPTYADYVVRPEDTAHGWVFASTAEDTVRLNQYCSGTPVSGTRVTTWPKTGDITQVWAQYYCVGPNNQVDYSRIALVPESNVTVQASTYTGVAINSNRSAVGTEVNLYPIGQNMFSDYAMYIRITGGGHNSRGKWYDSCTLSLAPRGNQTQEVYITRTNTGTGDSQNLGRKCVWNYRNTGSTTQNWYMLNATD